MVTEVKLHYFHGRGSTMAVGAKFFLPFLNEFGNSKLFELYILDFFTATAVVLPSFRHRGSTMALPADDLADCFTAV